MVHEKIQRFLTTHATKKSMAKGLDMYRYGYATRKSLDKNGTGKAVYTVQSDSGYGQYKVEIQNFIGKMPIVTTCSCPYDWGGACKHIVAAILDLDEMEELDQPPQTYQMLDCEVRLSDLSDHQLQYNVAPNLWKTRNTAQKADIVSAINGIAECTVRHNKQDYAMRFTRIDPGHLHTSCSCNQELTEPLCSHKLAALLALREQFGIMAFEVMRDWTEEKNRMLAEYGFSTADNLDGKFQFKINNAGKLEMTVLDKSLRSLKHLKDWWNTTGKKFDTDNQAFKVPKQDEEESGNTLVLVFSFTLLGDDALPDVTLTPLTARYNAAKDKLSHIGKMENLYGGYDTEIPAISQQESLLLNIAKKDLRTNTLMAAIRASGEPLPRWVYSLSQKEIGEGPLRAAQIHIGKIWARAFPLLKDKITVISPNQYHHLNSLQRVQVIPDPVRLGFEMRQEESIAVLEGFAEIDGVSVPLASVKRYGFWLLGFGGKLARLASWNDAAMVQQFAPAGKFTVRQSQLDGFLTDFVLPLTEHFSVSLNIDKPIDFQTLNFKEGRIYLKEDEENLVFVPAYAYLNQTGGDDAEEWEFSADGRRNKVSYDGDHITVWERDPAPEKAFFAFAMNLHPDFQGQAGQPFFYLPFADALKDNWLYRFFEQTSEQQVPVFGFAQLKKFKYNPNRPAFRVKASSGIDWFDMQMEVGFGDQFISLNDLKKAVVNKQNYVQLADGTIGMLPEEWLEKYANLFKFGQVKGDSIKLSKLHFSVIDDLYGQIDNEKIRQEIEEKKFKLLNFREIKNVKLPKKVRAQLRDYQIEGFRWLNFLDEFKWGGCLADDMGLGKTLQVLTFLQRQKELQPGLTNLVVVPTTLIFNWQAEVEKFAPEMQVFVHRGVGRQKDIAFFRDFDIIITTYGTLRSDIGHLKDFLFHYIVLDESQAIKNPDAQVSKAVKLLSARNRLVMTGTPVENNTFDLYSQIEFLNPGLLGSQDFFRTEFANPIDKNRDENAARALRKIIYPFILKRTKEEVAKDLPDKTETTLFCEMGKKQRKVYDTFRELYRAKIASKMETDGRDKAAFLILEGLLKLRQICDSPALLSDDADYGHDSAKLDEIIREIGENAGHHKILIFSQFLKMLDLIRNHLEKDRIPYEYLDGSTIDRASRVQRFQESEQCRVFLMSLKAGGVGINLTEADYVYLVDPWWNPAVEQQAIDRTHRIGQTKKVFAYKMICKDTIEEKILQLQDKKKDIAKELISTEQGFIKKLTKEDIIGLFS